MQGRCWKNLVIPFRITTITTFPKEFFNEIWLKLGDHEYINIAEIKFEQFYSRAIFFFFFFIIIIIYVGRGTSWH